MGLIKVTLGFLEYVPENEEKKPVKSRDKYL